MLADPIRVVFWPEQPVRALNGHAARCADAAVMRLIRRRTRRIQRTLHATHGWRPCGRTSQTDGIARDYCGRIGGVVSTGREIANRDDQSRGCAIDQNFKGKTFATAWG